MYITWQELVLMALLVLIVLGIIAGVYIILLVRNLHSSAKVVKKLLNDNQDNLNSTLGELPGISKNLSEITETAKNEVKVLENTLNSINETVEMSAATVSSIKDNIVGKIGGVVGALDLIRHLIFKNKGK